MWSCDCVSARVYGVALGKYAQRSVKLRLRVFSRARLAASASPLRFAVPASLGGPAQAFLAWAFAGITVHRTVVFFRLTHSHLRALVTIPGEKCGLEAERILDIKVYSALGSNEGRLPYADATYRCAVRVRRAGRMASPLMGSPGPRGGMCAAS